MFNKLFDKFIIKTNNLKNKIFGGEYNIENFDFGYISSYLLLINTLIYIFYNIFKNNTTQNETIYFSLCLTLSILYLHLDNNNYIKKNKDLIIFIGGINSLLMILPYFISIIYIISRIDNTNKIFDQFFNELIKYINSF